MGNDGSSLKSGIIAVTKEYEPISVGWVHSTEPNCDTWNLHTWWRLELQPVSNGYRLISATGSGGGAEPAAIVPIKLKDGRTITPHDADSAAAFRKDHPELIAPIVQRNKKTGAYRYSTDGGQTWQPGQPQAAAAGDKDPLGILK